MCSTPLRIMFNFNKQKRRRLSNHLNIIDIHCFRKHMKHSLGTETSKIKGKTRSNSLLLTGIKGMLSLFLIIWTKKQKGELNIKI